MATRAVAATAAAIAVAVLAAGCATAVTGTPRAGSVPPTGAVETPTTDSTADSTTESSTEPPTESTAESTTESTAESTPESTAASTAESSAHASTDPTETSGSIRPMPPLSSTDGSGSSTDSPTTAATDSTIAGVDLDAVLADLDRRHVSGVDSTARLDKLASMVGDARSAGLELSVVSIGRTITDANTSAISRALFAQIGGTVLVLSPALVSARSDQLTSAQREDAIQSAADGKDDEHAVARFISSALASTGMTPTTSPATKSTDPAPPSTVGGIAIAPILKALGSDHIAIAKDLSEVTAKDLVPVVRKAWKADLKVYVAVIDKDATGHLYDVAAAVMDHTGGTVIMVSPSVYAIASKELTDKQLDAALDAGADAKSYASLVRAMVDSML